MHHWAKQAATLDFCNHNTTLLPQITRVLKSLYDYDIVVDSIILAWHQNATVGSALGVALEDAEKIRKISGPFIDWLEEESDEESDEE